MFFAAHDRLTELCRIMMKHGSDKGGYQGIGKHNYTVFYHQLFSCKRSSAESVFEFGIGSTRADIRHTMGDKGVPGASLRGWREYFSKAHIYAADIDKAILQPEDRITKFFCDQTSEASINELWQSEPLAGVEFDVILEDGLHLFEAQHLFMEKSLHKLKRDGIYICEDVPDKDAPLWSKALRAMAERFPNRTFQLIKIDNRLNSWNSVVVVQ